MSAMLDDLRIILPVRPAEEGKTRLADALTPAIRADLSRRLFAHVLDVAIAAVGAGRVIVVTRSSEFERFARLRGTATADEPEGGGLSPALEAAAARARAGGARQIVSISCDLPMLEVADIAALIDAGRGGIAIAPDYHGTGTNALLIGADAIPYAYGEGSFNRHRQSAAASRLHMAIVRREGLARDLDTPDDLAGLCGCALLSDLMSV